MTRMLEKQVNTMVPFFWKVIFSIVMFTSIACTTSQKYIHKEYIGQALDTISQKELVSKLTSTHELLYAVNFDSQKNELRIALISKSEFPLYLNHFPSEKPHGYMYLNGIVTFFYRDRINSLDTKRLSQYPDLSCTKPAPSAKFDATKMPIPPPIVEPTIYIYRVMSTHIDFLASGLDYGLFE